MQKPFVFLVLFAVLGILPSLAPLYADEFKVGDYLFCGHSLKECQKPKACIGGEGYEFKSDHTGLYWTGKHEREFTWALQNKKVAIIVEKKHNHDVFYHGKGIISHNNLFLLHRSRCPGYK